MGELRETKKRETRQRISDVATKLFLTRGFDAVTLEDVAAAAKVSKMTVFNYFPRKEDLMLDRKDDLELVFFRDAIRARPKGQSPVAALRALMKDLRAGKQPIVRVDRMTAGFWRFVSSTPALEARVRELDERAAEGLVAELDAPRAIATLAAGMIVLTVRTARREAFDVLEAGGSAKKANEVLFDLVDRGLAAVEWMVER